MKRAILTVDAKCGFLGVKCRRAERESKRAGGGIKAGAGPSASVAPAKTAKLPSCRVRSPRTPGQMGIAIYTDRDTHTHIMFHEGGKRSSVYITMNRGMHCQSQFVSVSLCLSLSHHRSLSFYDPPCSSLRRAHAYSVILSECR